MHGPNSSLGLCVPEVWNLLVLSRYRSPAAKALLLHGPGLSTLVMNGSEVDLLSPTPSLTESQVGTEVGARAGEVRGGEAHSLPGGNPPAYQHRWTAQRMPNVATQSNAASHHPKGESSPAKTRPVTKSIGPTAAEACGACTRGFTGPT